MKFKFNLLTVRVKMPKMINRMKVSFLGIATLSYILPIIINPIPINIITIQVYIYIPFARLLTSVRGLSGS